MAKKNMKYTKEELEAMKIQALLQGIDPSTITNEVIEDDIDELVEEAVNPKKKRGTTKKKKEETVFKQEYIETLPEYANLKTDLTLNVTFNQHDIHYKEQLWPIPLVNRTYKVELVKIPIAAKRIAELVSKNNITEMDKAYRGQVRYFKLVCYDTVPYAAKELGYIRVSVKDGKLVSKAFPLLKEAKENHINPDKLKKDLNKKALDLLA